jgi:hypothetical protein
LKKAPPPPGAARDSRVHENEIGLATAADQDALAQDPILAQRLAWQGNQARNLRHQFRNGIIVLRLRP